MRSAHRISFRAYFLVLVAIAATSMISCAPQVVVQPFLRCPEQRNIGRLATAVAGEGVASIGNYDLQACRQVGVSELVALTRLYFENITYLFPEPIRDILHARDGETGEVIPCLAGSPCYLRVISELQGQVTIQNNNEQLTVTCPKCWLANPESRCSLRVPLSPPSLSQPESNKSWVQSEPEPDPRTSGYRGNVIVAPKITLSGEIRPGQLDLVLVAREIHFANAHIVTQADWRDHPAPRDGQPGAFELPGNPAMAGMAGSGSVILIAERVTGTGSIDTSGMLGGRGGQGANGWSILAAPAPADSLYEGFWLQLVEQSLGGTNCTSLRGSVESGVTVGGPGYNGGKGTPGTRAGSVLVIVREQMPRSVEIREPFGGHGGLGGSPGLGAVKYRADRCNWTTCATLTQRDRQLEESIGVEAAERELTRRMLRWFSGCAVALDERLPSGTTGPGGAHGLPGVVQTLLVSQAAIDFLAYEFGRRGMDTILLDGHFHAKGGRDTATQAPQARAQELYNAGLSMYCAHANSTPTNLVQNSSSLQLPLRGAAGEEHFAAWTHACRDASLRRARVQEGLDFYGLSKGYMTNLQPEALAAIRGRLLSHFQAIRGRWQAVSQDLESIEGFQAVLEGQAYEFGFAAAEKAREVERASRQIEILSFRLGQILRQISDISFTMRNKRSRLIAGCTPEQICANDDASWIRVSPATNTAPGYILGPGVEYCACETPQPLDDREGRYDPATGVCGVTVAAEFARAQDCLVPLPCDWSCSFGAFFDIVVAGVRIIDSLVGAISTFSDNWDAFSEIAPTIFTMREPQWTEIIEVTEAAFADFSYEELSTRWEELKAGMDQLDDVPPGVVLPALLSISRNADMQDALLQSNLTAFYQTLRQVEQDAGEVTNRDLALARLMTIRDLYQQLQDLVRQIPELTFEYLYVAEQLLEASNNRELARVAQAEAAALYHAAQSRVDTYNDPLANKRGLRDELCRLGSVTQERLLLLDSFWRRSWDFMALADPEPYNYTQQLLRTDVVGGYDAFIAAEAQVTAEHEFVDILSRWREAGPRAVCEILLKEGYRFSTAATDQQCGATRIDQLTQYSREELVGLGLPFSSGDPPPSCCVPSGTSVLQSCAGALACDTSRPAWNSYCAGPGAIVCAGASSYTEAVRRYIANVLSGKVSPSLAKVYYSNALLRDLLNDGRAVLHIDPSWSTELRVAEQACAAQRVTDFDIRMIVDSSRLPADPYTGERLRIGGLSIEHGFWSYYTRTPGGFDVETPRETLNVLLSPALLVNVCKAVASTFDPLAAYLTSENPPPGSFMQQCEPLANTHIYSYEDENGEALRTTDAETLAAARFADNRLFGVSVRGEWTIDIRETLARAYALDVERDTTQGSQHTQVVARLASGLCPAGSLDTVNRGCIRDACDQGSACQELRDAIVGIELKIFWRSRDCLSSN